MARCDARRFRLPAGIGFAVALQVCRAAEIPRLVLTEILAVAVGVGVEFPEAWALRAPRIVRILRHGCPPGPVTLSDQMIGLPPVTATVAPET
jgi:hypothetical protein